MTLYSDSYSLNTMRKWCARRKRKDIPFLLKTLQECSNLFVPSNVTELSPKKIHMVRIPVKIGINPPFCVLLSRKTLNLVPFFNFCGEWQSNIAKRYVRVQP